MSASWTAWVADALVLAGLVVATVAVVGVIRLPDVYMKLHAAGKAASLAILTLALATVATGEAEIFLRSILAAFFLLLTAPVSAHAIARAARESNEPMRGPDAIDESGQLGGDDER